MGILSQGRKRLLRYVTGYEGKVQQARSMPGNPLY